RELAENRYARSFLRALDDFVRRDRVVAEIEAALLEVRTGEVELDRREDPEIRAALDDVDVLVLRAPDDALDDRQPQGLQDGHIVRQEVLPGIARNADGGVQPRRRFVQARRRIAGPFVGADGFRHQAPHDLDWEELAEITAMPVRS